MKYIAGSKAVVLLTVIPSLYWVAVGASSEKWRRPRWDTQARTYTIHMPDYHHASRTEWRDQRSDAWSQLAAIADDALQSVVDERLTIEQRTDALEIVELFPAMLTAKKLTEVIDLKDERRFFYAEKNRGEYPIVSVLVNYGAPAAQDARGDCRVVNAVGSALARETDPLRRKLLVDVLQRLIGLKQSLETLKTYLEQDDRWSADERRNLQTAVDELRQRQE